MKVLGRGTRAVRGVEGEMVPFHQPETLVILAKADVFEAMRLAS